MQIIKMRMRGKKFTYYLLILVIPIILTACGKVKIPDQAIEINQNPKIFPEYFDVTIPPNIAPLNFLVQEEGDDFVIRIYAKKGNEIHLKSRHPQIKMDLKEWKNLLEQNRGEALNIDVYAKTGAEWKKFNTIKNTIAIENIDSYVSYRLINSAYVLWFEMGIYQRNLENFDESPIIENKSIGGACVNCHSLSRNDPDKFMFHIRARHPGTLIYNAGKLEKVETKTDFTMASAAYGAWNPNGRHIAFSVNKINQNFYVFKDQSNEVSDKYSDLVVYDTKTNVITTAPQVSTRSRENLPEWSADGKEIYFISTNEATDDSTRMITKYSLMHVPYDVETNAWGEPDTLISANETGESITFPRASPDGRYIAFCMTNYGYFTIHHKTSDLYLLDLKTGKYWATDKLNSSETESYHSWSTNSRWLIFSSRRIDGIHTRTFIAYLDENGHFHKPFVLPQEDPKKYNNYLLNYNRPELMTGKISVSPRQIRDAIIKDAIPVTFDPNINIDAISGASRINTQ